jgi:hypothetical protein
MKDLLDVIKDREVVYIVGNTMPIKYILLMKNFVRDYSIILDGNSFYESYNQIFPNEKIHKKTGINHFEVSISCKLSNKTIITFHECCMLMLDLSIKLLNPTHISIPIQNNEQRKKLQSTPQPSFKNMIKYLLFDTYEEYLVGRKKNVYSLKKYGSNTSLVDAIQLMSVLECQELEAVPLPISVSERVCILLIDNYFSERNRAFDFYSKVIEILLDCNVNILLKEHPSSEIALNLKFSDISLVYLDSKIPLECYDMDNVSAILGISSTLLATTKCNTSISLLPELQRFDNNSEFDGQRAKNNLAKISSTILYLTLDELEYECKKL